MIQLSNHKLSVTVSEKGAELQSIKHKGLEYLWQADEKYWGKHAPVLFPIVGELKDGKYTYDGCEYKLPRHGFARDKTFTVKDKTKTSVLLTLKGDDESLEVYPFMFTFEVRYSIKGSSLNCCYIVQNTDVKTIFFSVGGHPAFKAPLQDELQYEDYYLEFNNDAVLHKHLLHNGLTGNDTKAIKLEENVLPLHASLFYEDAIVLKDMQSNTIELKTNADEHGLKFSFDGFPYFGIWAAKDAPFVCLEPWCGIADNINHDYRLERKEGINILPAGEQWEKSWCAEFF